MVLVTTVVFVVRGNHSRQCCLRHHRDNLSPGYAGLDYWIGANNQHADGQYHWLDGSKVKMGTPFWGVYKGHQEPGSATEHCAMLFKSDFYFMHDYGCDESLYPICEAK